MSDLPRLVLAAHLSDLIEASKSAGFTFSIELVRKLSALKSVKSIVGDYEVTLTTAVVDYFNGDATLSRVRGTFSRSPREYAREVYLEGMSEGGLTEEDLDDEDERTIADWIATQKDSVEGFVDFCRTIKDVDQDQRSARQGAILSRAGMWVNSLAELGGLGRIRGKEGELATWELGDTEEHCSSCLTNSDLKPHRLKWWRDSGRLPRSRELDCHGYNCDCTLRSPKTRMVLYP